MTQTIKPNDLVYIPSVSFRLHKVVLGGGDLLILHAWSRNIYHINREGCLYNPHTNKWHTQQFAFLATPENKEKLERVYGWLEDIPVDKN